MRRIDRHFAVKHAPEARIGRARAIVHGEVRELVNGRPCEPISGGDGLVRLGRGSDVEEDSIAGRCDRARVGAVAEVLQEHVDAAVGYVAEQFPVRGEPAHEALRRVRDEMGLGRIKIDDPQLIGLDEIETGPDRRSHAEHDGKRRCQA